MSVMTPDMWLSLGEEISKGYDGTGGCEERELWGPDNHYIPR